MDSGDTPARLGTGGGGEFGRGEGWEWELSFPFWGFLKLVEARILWGCFKKLVLRFGLLLQLSCKSYGRFVAYRALGPNDRSGGHKSSLIPGEGS